MDLNDIITGTLFTTVKLTQENTCTIEMTREKPTSKVSILLKVMFLILKIFK